MRHSEVARLVGDARAGSKTALGALLQMYRPLLLDLSRRTMPPELAGKIRPSDLVQNTCIDAVRSLKQLRAETEQECRAWLCALLVRNIADAARRYLYAQKREFKREQSLHFDGSDLRPLTLVSKGGAPPDVAISHEEIECSLRALARLSAKDQALLELRIRNRLSFVEIAAKLGKTPDAVRMQWNRAISRFARALASDGRTPKKTLDIFPLDSGESGIRGTEFV
jgi:RNA polymerase sigma-70 factor, ECF subfamily